MLNVGEEQLLEVSKETRMDIDVQRVHYSAEFSLIVNEKEEIIQYGKFAGKTNPKPLMV